MISRVECTSCGKYSWGGCGKHLATLYGSIDEGKHCMCRSWPGLDIPSQSQRTTTTPDPSPGPSQQSGNSSQGNENPQNS